MNSNILAENRKALFDYEVIETYQAGIILNGQEVKSIKNGRISLAGSFVILKENEVFLLNADVPPYQPNNIYGEYEAKRSRKLLLQKSEINELIGKTKQKGLTMVPLKVYNHKGKVKIEFALAKGKKKADKREKIKTREADRDIQRALSRG